MASSAVAESPEPDLSNITAPEAAAQARESNQAVAVTAEYTKTTQVFANPDGTFTAEIASGPVQIPSEETANGWEDIDTTLADTGGIVEPEAAAAVIEFSDGGDAELASLATGTRQFGMDWTSTLPAPSLAGDIATYSDVLPGIDLTLQARPQGFEQNLVVAEPPTEPIVVQLPLELKGLSATVDADGQMVMTDSTGKPVIAADPARMWGAEIDPANDEPTVQAYVDTRVVNTATGPKLELAPDPEFFTRPGLTYPVTVDPAPDLAVDKDTYVDSSQPGQFFRNDTYLKTGSPDGSAKTRSYLKFGVASLAGKHINSATMKLYATFSASCNNTTVQVFEANDPGIKTDTTWNNQPGQGAKYADKSFSAGCGGGGGGWIGFDSGGYNGMTMTDLVQKWADNTSINYGVRLEAQNETSSAGYKKYKSSESSAHVPVLSVNYDSYPSTPSGVSISVGVDGLPTFHGTFTDPDGGAGRVLYKVIDFPSGAAVIEEGMGESVSSGLDSPYVVAPGILRDGASYSVSARGFDGVNSSSWVTVGSFQLNTTPEMPDGGFHIDGQWTTGGFNVAAATYRDDNLGTGHSDFQVMDAVCGQVLASGSGTQVSEGGISTWAIPASAGITIGNTYTIRARGVDETGDTSPWTTCDPFDAVSRVDLIGLETIQNSTTPTLQAELAADASAGTNVAFFVYSTDGSVLAHATVTPANGHAEWQVPSGILGLGGYYFVEASASYAVPSGATDIYTTNGGGQAAAITGVYPGQQIDGYYDVTIATHALDQVSAVEYFIDGQLEAIVTSNRVPELPWGATFLAVASPGGSETHTLTARVSGVAGGQPVVVTTAPVSITYVDKNNGQESAPASMAEVSDAIVDRPEAGVEDVQPSAPSSSAQPRLVTPAEFRQRMIDYAQTYWGPERGDWNKAYKVWDEEFDCTNFMSQVLRHGGWPWKKFGQDLDGTSAWWYDVRDGADEASFTWRLADYMMRGMWYGGLDPRTKQITARGGSSSKWVPSVRLAERGDLVFFDWFDDCQEGNNTGPCGKDDSDGIVEYENREFDHVGIITAVRDENVYLTYHSINRKNIPLFPLAPGDWLYDKYGQGGSIRERVMDDEWPNYSRLFHVVVYRPHDVDP